MSSIQRRHQKLLEESPSMVVSEELRRSLGQKLCGMLSSIGYTNAGTVEFLMDEQGRPFHRDEHPHPVEHPVTEMVTDIDR